MSSLKFVERPTTGLPLAEPEEVGFSTARLGRKTVELMTINHTGDLDVYLM